MATTRMTKKERRRQLVEAAFEIIRTEGTDALSLVRLADRAGVSHPVPYEHFKVRRLTQHREKRPAPGRRADQTTRAAADQPVGTFLRSLGELHAPVSRTASGSG
jgi:hypothetical protein